MFRAIVQVRPADAAWAFALRAGLAVAVPLVTLVAAGHASWAGVATFGAFTALYGRDEPYRRRALVVAACGLGLVLAVAAGSLAALAPRPEVVAVAAVALVGAAATLLCNRYRVGPPAGLMFAFATAVTSALPTTPIGALRNVALAGASAVISWLIVMSGALVAPDGPQRLAVARALRAAAALHGATPGQPVLQARQQTALAIDRAWRAVSSTSPSPDPPSDSLSSADTPPDGRGSPSTAVETLLAHAETELSGMHPNTAETAAELRGLADRLMRRGPAPRVIPTPAEDATITARRRAAILLRDRPTTGPNRPLWPAAARVALGALAAGAVAGLLTSATGLGHPYWAAVSAVAVLQTASLRLSMHRAVQRAGGTILGLGIAAVAVAIPGGLWVLVAGIVLAQVVAELLVIRNYGLAMLAVTPLALLIGELGQPTPPVELISDRLIETILGCALGLGAAALVRNRAANRHLNEAITAVDQATTELRADPTNAGARRLAALVAVMREAYEVAAGEPAIDPEATARVLDAEQAARSALIGSAH